jgi:outer membrane protein
LFVTQGEKTHLACWEYFLGKTTVKFWEASMRLFKGLMSVGLLTGCCLLLSTAASPCWAADESPWMVRVRALGIYPDESSSTFTLAGVPISGQANVDDAYTLDLDISYFFTPNIAVELTLTYAQHDVNATATPLGYIDLGSLDLLPPTLTLQYHFLPNNKFRPYIGAGLSYVLIPNEDSGDALSVNYDDGQVGFALQAGFDYFFTKNWCLNVDVKKVWVDVDATVEVLPGAFVKTTVDVDPWLIGIGIGYRF